MNTPRININYDILKGRDCFNCDLHGSCAYPDECICHYHEVSRVVEGTLYEVVETNELLPCLKCAFKHLPTNFCNSTICGVGRLSRDKKIFYRRVSDTLNY